MTSRNIFRRAAIAALFIFFALPAALQLWAVTTQFWTIATYEEFSKGNFTNISLGREGSMTLSPQLDPVFDTEQAMIWAVARDSKGNLYLGTGHSGKVFRLGSDLKGTMIFDAEEPDIFALAVDKDNRLYVGTSPDGKVYRIDASGKSSEFFDPKAKYIWAMSFAPDGTLYVGTGDRGRIYRVRPDGKGDVFYDTSQTHVMSLAVDPNGEVFAGTEPNGLLYKVSSAGKAFVVYDSPQAEIHQITLGADGSIYAAVLGSSQGRAVRPASPQPATSPRPAAADTTITVRAADDPLQLPGQEGSPEPPSPQAGASAVIPAIAAGRVSTPARTPNGGSRSAIVRVHPDGTVDNLWSSTSESAFDLSPSASRLLFSTDEKGRIYELEGDHQLSLLAQTDQEQTTRLIPMGNYVLVTTANLGKVYRLGTSPAATGSFESDVRDAGNVAGWGQISWKADLPAGTSLELFTRTGNSAKPDATWSEWSTAYKSPEGELVRSPAARYAQWKAVFHSAANQSPSLHEVSLAYLPRNRAPEITELKAVPRSDRGGASVAVSGANGGGASGGARVFSGVAASRGNSQRGVDISWLATDPDQDELTYSLYFRGEGENEWKLLEDNMKQNYFQLNPDSLPDGVYRLRVVASDAGQNPAETAKADERVSAPFLVDFTPPEVKVLGVNQTTPSTSGAKVSVKIAFSASDSASALTRAEYALDAEPLQPILSDDGIVDSRQEMFTVRVIPPDDQEHLITLRVYDSVGNVGVAKAVLPARGMAGTSEKAKGQEKPPAGGK